MEVFDLVVKSPLDILENEEYENIINIYCSLICTLKNKKMNIPMIFVETVTKKSYFEIYKLMCGLDDDVTAVRKFLDFDHSIIKSKYSRKAFKSLKLK